ncbi:MAG: CoA-binding protein [Pseudomonadota bacterium]
MASTEAETASTLAAEEPLVYSDEILRRVLDETRTVAMVGASPNWNKPSYFVMKYLQKKGYRVIPVNPRAAGTEILGETVYADLASVPAPFEMVDIFRNSAAAGAITDEAIGLAADKGIRSIWMQLTVRNDAAARRAEDAGLMVIMDRCPKIEFGRLNGELGWNGFNSGQITTARRGVRRGKAFQKIC